MALASILVALALGVLAAVLAACETAVMVLPIGRVHRLEEAEAAGSGALLQLSMRPHRLRAVSAFAAALAFASVVELGIVLGDAIPLTPLVSVSRTLYVALLLVVVFALAQSLPRTLAIANPERVGLGTAGVAAAVTAALYPPVRLLGVPWRWALHLAAGEVLPSAWVTGGEYRSADNDEETEREEAEEAILEAVSDFAEKVVREVMVPRTDMNALPDTATAADAVAMIHRTGNTRLPVYHTTTDDIRGVLYAKDLLVALAENRAEGPLLAMARPPYFVPETKPVEELLLEMRVKTHIAIVADEYGGTAGIVTLEDLLEEIVGEISDEYDREEPLLVDLGDDRYVVDARWPVDDLNELFGTDIETDADSVGGLFTEVAGKIPDVGESVEIEGLRLTVTELSGTRLCKLTVEPSVRDTDEGESDA